ncbi:MAG: hypothetical protein A2176_03795 [Spirochaetes bacterium RBG_13_51_14]|nr:MAG: hypothetical protein A2176_03795 [Spirochaetes bacterium RBG_13_51_14]
MNIHYLQHVSFEGPAYLETIARELGAIFTGTMLHEGQRLPEKTDFDLLAVMGGPMGVYDEKKYPWLIDEKIFIEKSIRAGTRIIGICLGAQLIAEVMGALVYRNSCREIGWFTVQLNADARTTSAGRALPHVFFAFHWHSDTFDIPRGAVRIAESAACKNQGFIYQEQVVGLQFHLESTAESVRELYKNCGGELDGTRFVQQPVEILQMDYISGCNILFGKLIKELL